MTQNPAASLLAYGPSCVRTDAILRDGRADLPTALAAACAIYGAQFNPQITLKALSYFEDGDLPRLPPATKDRLAKASREVDLDRLQAIEGKPTK